MTCTPTHPTALAALLLALLAGLAACRAGDPEPAELPAAAEPAAAAFDPAELDAESWVAIYDPERAASGYNLVFWAARVPMLVDMNGRVVHAWPAARVKSRLRLLEDGSLLAISLGRSVVEYDWEGNLVWEYGDETMLPHHDVIRLANGNTMFVASFTGQATDDLLEVDRAGRVVWRWRSGDKLAAYIDEAERRAHPNDVTHINSVQELPANRHARRGDRRFRKGNLLVSARNLNEVFVVDRRTGDVVWSYDHRLDLQHEALMLPREHPAHGRIQLFNNGFRNAYDYRRSSIVEIEPSDSSVAWSYTADDFYSPTGGVEQPLENGNVLIGSTRGGRAFEVTRRGEIVWQWTPPFDPVRPARYAYDHCPQLAALGPPREEPVRPPRGYRWVDRRVHDFAPRWAQREVVLDGRKRTFLASNNQCRRLFLPARAALTAVYGVDRRELLRRDLPGYRARFALVVTVDGGDERLAFEETVGTEAAWRERRFGLEPWEFRHVEVCITTEAAPEGLAGPTEELAFWENLRIEPDRTSAAAATPGRDAEAEAADPDDLSPDELEARREHLRTLGYVD